MAEGFSPRDEQQEQTSGTPKNGAGERLRSMLERFRKKDPEVESDTDDEDDEEESSSEKKSSKKSFSSYFRTLFPKVVEKQPVEESKKSAADRSGSLIAFLRGEKDQNIERTEPSTAAEAEQVRYEARPADEHATEIAETITDMPQAEAGVEPALASQQTREHAGYEADTPIRKQEDVTEQPARLERLDFADTSEQPVAAEADRHTAEQTGRSSRTPETPSQEQKLDTARDATEAKDIPLAAPYIRVEQPRDAYAETYERERHYAATQAAKAEAPAPAEHTTETVYAGGAALAYNLYRTHRVAKRERENRREIESLKKETSDMRRTVERRNAERPLAPAPETRTAVVLPIALERPTDEVVFERAPAKIAVAPERDNRIVQPEQSQRLPVVERMQKPAPRPEKLQPQKAEAVVIERQYATQEKLIEKVQERRVKEIVKETLEQQNAEVDDPKELFYELSHEHKDFDKHTAATLAAAKAALLLADKKAAEAAQKAKQAEDAAAAAQQAAVDTTQPGKMPAVYQRAIFGGMATAVVLIAIILLIMLLQ